MNKQNESSTPLKIGLSTGRGTEYLADLLRKYNLISDDGPSSQSSSQSTKRRRLNSKYVPERAVKIVHCKPKDIARLLDNNMIIVACGYTDCQFWSDNPNYRIIDEHTEEKSFGRICVVCKKDRKDYILSELKKGGRYATLSLFSEYPLNMLPKTLLNACENKTVISGSVETWFGTDDCDIAVTLVQTGKTLKENNLIILEELDDIHVAKPCLFVKKGRWSDSMRYFVFRHLNLPIFVDGIDGSGKTTLVNALKSIGFDARDRSILTQLSLKPMFEWPDNIPFAIYIVLDCDLEVANDRILNRKEKKKDYWEEYKQQFYYRRVYRALCAKYGLYFIDTTSILSDTIIDVVINRLEDYVMPRIDVLSESDIDKLKIVNSGCSKVVYKLNDNYHLVKDIPSVYSHRQQRAGMVEQTDKLRMRMFACMLHVLWANGIDHTTVFVGKSFILVQPLNNNDIPPIEICVKKYFIGSDKHRYYGLDKRMDLQTEFSSEGKEYKPYPTPLVRFDWRNPNHHPLTNEPLGDQTLYEDLAKYFIDTDAARQTVTKAFDAIYNFLIYSGIRLIDICMMTDKSGKRLYYEISQDCCRMKLIDGGTSVDKDNWRDGKSHDNIRETWAIACTRVEENVERYLKLERQVLG